MDKYKIFCYKIWWEGKDDLYVGSTKQALSMRMAKHRHCAKKGRTDMKIYNAIRNNGYDFNYCALESYDVSCSEDKRKWEQRHIDLLKPNLNMYAAYATLERKKIKKAEYSKTSRENNKDKIKVKKRQEYLDNIDKIKTYRKNNEHRIKEKSKQYRKINKDKIIAINEQYRKNNRNEINERKKIKAECECGSIVRRSELLRHKRTKKHKHSMTLFYLNLLPFTS